MVKVRMHTRNVLAIFLIATSIAVATVSIATQALAVDDPARGGLDKADKNVHDNTGGLSDQDIRFHEGTCQGGHSTTVLDNLGGCDILPPPGGK